MISSRVKPRHADYPAKLPGVKIEKATEVRLLALCDATGKTMSDIVREALARYLHDASQA